MCLKNDTYYINVKANDHFYEAKDSVAYMNEYAKYLGGTVAMFETEEEYQNYRNQQQSSGMLGLVKDYKTNTYKWFNGSPYTLSLPIVSETTSDNIHLILENNQIVERYYSYNFILEVKANRYLDNIQVPNQNVSVDMESTYQIEPYSSMKGADLSGLKYSSDDQGIVNVSETGLITPVGYGKATIYISSPDYQRYTLLTVNVIRKIELYDFIVEPVVTMDKGEQFQLLPKLVPSNTTQGNLTFESSNPNVIAVNSAGRLNALDVGTSTITVHSNATNKTITFDVVVETAVESINFVDSIYVTTLNKENDELKFDLFPLKKLVKQLYYLKVQILRLRILMNLVFSLN